MTLYLAYKELQTAIETGLINAGFVNGSTLNNTAIKAEKKPIFWFLQITSSEGSTKQDYITYDIRDFMPIAYGDGKSLKRQAVIDINFYSRKKNIDVHFENLNNQFVDNFELNKISYDSGNKIYQYSFIVNLLVV